MTTFNAKRAKQAKRMAKKIKDGEYEQVPDAVLNKLDIISAQIGAIKGVSLSSILGDIASRTKDVVSKGISFTLNGGKKIFNKVITSGQNAFEYLKDKVGSIASSIGDVAAHAISAMGNFVSSAKDKVKSVATTTIEKAKEMWGKGKVWIAGKWEDAKKYGINKWEQAKECAKDAWSWLTGKAKSGAEKTTSFFKRMFGLGGEDFAKYHNSVLLKLDTIIDAIKGTSDKPVQQQESYGDSIEERDPNDAYYQYQQMLQDQEPGEFDSRTGERRKKTRFNSFFGKLGRGIKGLGKLGWKGLKLGAKLGWKGAKLAGKGYWKYLKTVGKGYWKLGKLGIKGVGLLGRGLSYLAFGDDTDTDTKAPQERKQNNELANQIDEAFSTKEKRQELINHLEGRLEKIPKDTSDELYNKTKRAIELLKTTDFTPSQIRQMIHEEYQGGLKGALSKVKNLAKSIFKFDKKKEVAEEAKTTFNSKIGTQFKKISKAKQNEALESIKNTNDNIRDQMQGLNIKQLILK